MRCKLKSTRKAVEQEPIVLSGNAPPKQSFQVALFLEQQNCLSAYDNELQNNSGPKLTLRGGLSP